MVMQLVLYKFEKRDQLIVEIEEKCWLRQRYYVINEKTKVESNDI